MIFFSRIKSLMNKQPQEQMVGHSLSELESIFAAPLLHANQALPDPPTVVSLETAGIHAYCISLLIDGEDIHKLAALVESTFSITHERVSNDCPVRRYKSAEKNQDLILLTSTRELTLSRQEW